MKRLKRGTLLVLLTLGFNGVVLAAPSTAPSTAPGQGQTGTSHVPNGGRYSDTNGNSTYSYSNTNAGGASSGGTGWTNTGTGAGNMGPGDGLDNRPGLGANQGCPHWQTGCASNTLPPPPPPPGCETNGSCPLTLDRGPNPLNLEIMITRDGSLTGTGSECGGNPEDCHDQAKSPNATGLQFVDVTGNSVAGNGLLGLPEGMNSTLRTIVFTQRGGLNVGQ